MGDVSGTYKAETQGNKNTSTSLSPVNDTVYPTNKAVKTYIDNAIAASKQALYPVGSLYFNASDSTDPGVLLGFGTWVAYAKGQVPVGLDTTQTEFATAGQTGGDKNLQSHTHTRGTMNITSTNNGLHPAWTDGSGGGIMMNSQDAGALYTSRPSSDGYWWAAVTSSGGAGVNTQYHTRINFDASRTWTGETSAAGTGNSQNLQPYVTVYIWKRTA